MIQCPFELEKSYRVRREFTFHTSQLAVGDIVRFESIMIVILENGPTDGTTETLMYAFKSDTDDMPRVWFPRPPETVYCWAEYFEVVAIPL